MKRKLAVLCVLVLMLSLVTTTALAWTCSNCSQSCSGNFCSNCGAAKPVITSSGSISNVRFTMQDNGDVVVRWDDSSNNGPYTVKYTTDFWNTTWHEEDSYNSKVATLIYLIPGVTYSVTIANAGGSKKTVEYKVPMQVYTEFKTGGQYLNLTESVFSLSYLEDNPLETFEVRTSWPQLKMSRDYAAKLVLKTPYGYTGTMRYWTSFTLENRYSYRYSTYSLYHDWLLDVEEDFGEIPVGEYTFEMYFDGQLYDYATFRVRK